MRHFTEELDQLNISDSMNDMVVIEGFMDRYDVSFDEAEEILCETKKFLALAADCENGDGLFIDKPLQIIDEMWHTFILHTNQYVSFCLNSFKHFIHHKPTSNSEKAVLKENFDKDPTRFIEEHVKRLEKQYSKIYDKYGSETLIKWYDEWANKYTPEYINQIKKAS